MFFGSADIYKKESYYPNENDTREQCKFQRNENVLFCPLFLSPQASPGFRIRSSEMARDQSKRIRPLKIACIAGNII